MMVYRVRLCLIAIGAMLLTGCAVGGYHLHTFQDTQTMGQGKFEFRQDYSLSPTLLAVGDVDNRQVRIFAGKKLDSLGVLPVLGGVGVYGRVGVFNTLDVGVHGFAHVNVLIPVSAGYRFFLTFADSIPASSLRYGISPFYERIASNAGAFETAGITMPLRIHYDSSKSISFIPNVRYVRYQAHNLLVPGVTLSIREKRTVFELSAVLINGQFMPSLGIAFPTFVEMIVNAIQGK